MRPLRLLTGISPKQASLLENRLTWLAPPLVIPALRYMSDPPEIRNQLFVRDFSTYTIGAALFYAAGAAAARLLKQTRRTLQGPVKNLLTFGVALSANLLYAGLGAPRLSRWVQSQTAVPKMPAEGVDKPVVSVRTQTPVPDSSARFAYSYPSFAVGYPRALAGFR